MFWVQHVAHVVHQVMSFVHTHVWRFAVDKAFTSPSYIMLAILVVLVKETSLIG